MYRDESASELAARLGTPDEPFVLDVRNPDEFAEWRIRGAVNIPLTELDERCGEVPRDREVVTVCASGNRSSTAADLLSHRGWKVATLRGGMTAWGAVYDSVTLDAGDARVVQVRRRGKGCLSYVVGSGQEAAVVDPTVDIDVYREVAAEHGWTITHVLDTHLHADHLSGARALSLETGATLHLNPADAFHFDFTPLTDGESITLEGGATLTVAAVHTPGHTLGSTIYFVGRDVVLTGDTLFVESVGRPDLAERAEEFARNLHRSLRERVLVLGDDALVLPGHYGDDVAVHPDEPVAARLGDLRRTLTVLQLDEDAFVEWATSRTAPRPPSYVEIIKANMGRPETPVAVLQRLEMGPNRCSA